MSIRIALAGKKGNGKTTLLNYLTAQFKANNLSIATLKFADDLYFMQNMTQHILNIPKIKDRQFLQIMGTDWGRQYDPDMWIKSIANRIEMTTAQVIIIDDLRFKNELEYLKNNNFQCIYLENNNSEYDSHPSENGIQASDFEHIISNWVDGTKMGRKLSLLKAQIITHFIDCPLIESINWFPLPVADSIYQHYKGNHYKILCTTIDKTRSDFQVVYWNSDTGMIYSRSLSEFLEYLPDTEVNRFTLI